MKKEFIIQRQGKDMVLYAGLLDLAHTKGLTGIDTELIQVPHEANGNTAIVKAVATLAGENGELRAYSGIGDAAPNNVAPPMRTALIRMAETRAKARALRDATNIGAAAFEELGPEEDDQPVAPRRQPVPIRPEVVEPEQSAGHKVLERARLAASKMASSEPASDKVVQHVAGLLFDALGDEDDCDLLVRAIFENGLNGLKAEQAAFLDKWAANDQFKRQAAAVVVVAKAEQVPVAAAE